MKTYKSRVVDAILSRKLRGVGAVLVQGPKWCGKTTTCEQQAKSVLYMADPDTKESNRLLADINIKALFEGDKPRLIDEWQLVPKFWDAVRFYVDHNEGFGHFILTGSAVPVDDGQIAHSGTGRIARLTMRPMSLWESGESSGELSLQSLFAGEDFVSCKSKNLALNDIAYALCRGGWPQSVLQGGEDALERAYEYYGAVVESDISRVDGIARDPDRAMSLMKSYARLQGTASSLSVIRKDMIANDSDRLSDDTINAYLKALRKIFVVEDMSAWSPNLRSKTPVRTSDTRYFVDPSLAVAALGIGPGDLMKDLATMGLMFETMAMRDLRVYAESIYGSVSHYTDASGLECDAIIHLRNGKYALVEIKLGGDTLVEKGVNSLKSLENKLDTERLGKPAFRMVLTATGEFAYRRKDDGIIVCPLSALRP